MKIDKLILLASVLLAGCAAHPIHEGTPDAVDLYTSKLGIAAGQPIAMQSKCSVASYTSGTLSARYRPCLFVFDGMKVGVLALEGNGYEVVFDKTISDLSGVGLYKTFWGRRQLQIEAGTQGLAIWFLSNGFPDDSAGEKSFTLLTGAGVRTIAATRLIQNIDQDGMMIFVPQKK